MADDYFGGYGGGDYGGGSYGGGGGLASGSTGAAYSGGGGYGGYGGGDYGSGGYGGYGGGYDELALLEQERLAREQEQQQQAASPFLSSQGPLFGSIVPPQPELGPEAVAPEAVAAPTPPEVAPPSVVENPLIQQRALQDVQGRLESAAEEYRNATNPAEQGIAKIKYQDLLTEKQAFGGLPTRGEQLTLAREGQERMMQGERARLEQDPGVRHYREALAKQGINPFKIGTATLSKSGEMYVPTRAEEAKAREIAKEQREAYVKMPEGLEKTKFGIQTGGVDLSNPVAGWNKGSAEAAALEEVLGEKSGRARAKEEGIKGLQEREEAQMAEAKERGEKKRAEDEAIWQREQEALEAEIRTRQENARIRDLWDIGRRSV